MSLPTLFTWADGDDFFAVNINGNFGNMQNYLDTYAVFKNADATLANVYTFAQKPIFSAGLTLNNQLRVTAGGAIIDTGGLEIDGGGLSVVGNTDITGNATVSGILNVNGAGIGAVALSLSGQLTMGASAPIVSGNAATFAGSVTAGSFYGAATGLTAIPGSALTGTVASSLLSGALPAINGESLTAIAASALTGTIAAARLPTDIGSRTVNTLSFVNGGSGTAFVMDDDYVATGAFTPGGMTNAPINAGVWKWIKITGTASGYSETCYIPSLWVP